MKKARTKVLRYEGGRIIKTVTPIGSESQEGRSSIIFVLSIVSMVSAGRQRSRCGGKKSPVWHVEFKVPLGHLSSDVVSPWECQAGAQKEVCARVKLYFV